MIEKLLARGARVDGTCKYGQAPLDLAIQIGDRRIVELLEGAGAGPENELEEPAQKEPENRIDMGINRYPCRLKFTWVAIISISS